jgi:protein TonB
VEFAPVDMLAASPRRTGVALLVSVAMHAIVFAIALFTLSMHVPTTTPIVVFPISLVGAPGGGGGSGGSEAAPPPEPPTPEPPPPAPKEASVAPAEPVAPPPVVAKPKPQSKPKPAPPATSTASRTGERATPAAPPGGSTTGGGGGGSGGGPGGNGGGFASATPQYGTNPEPPYPIAARRLGLEGTVLLRVVVAPDGSPREVSVLHSSGHDVLDDSAATTVRTRWRFVPARRDGVPIEDSVQVPIRFHRTAG